MTAREWVWVGAKSTGTSHLKAGDGCDDWASCAEFSGEGLSTLIAIVSDGAGSARFSHIGSRIVCCRLTRAAMRFLRSGKLVSDITEQVVREWLDEVRDTISVAAKELSATPRDFAATLVAALVGESYSLFVHIGDGAAVFRSDHSHSWTVASWPAHGEYASTTFFVTDDPEPRVRLVSIDFAIDAVALFTDGLERLILDFSTKLPHAPFFDSLERPLLGLDPGRNRKLSAHLLEMLESPQICSKTDDDKTIIIAKRLG